MEIEIHQVKFRLGGFPNEKKIYCKGKLLFRNDRFDCACYISSGIVTIVIAVVIPVEACTGIGSLVFPGLTKMS